MEEAKAFICSLGMAFGTGDVESRKFGCTRIWCGYGGKFDMLEGGRCHMTFVDVTLMFC